MPTSSASGARRPSGSGSSPRTRRRRAGVRTDRPLIEPIRLSFEVDCPPDHAFEIWTGRIDQWWPADHTVTGEDGLTVVLEGRPGGRIFERTPSGAEHDWGEVTVWDPPERFALPVASAPRPRRRDRCRDPVRRPAATAPRGSRSSMPAGSDSGPRARRGATGTTAAGRRCSPTSSSAPPGATTRRPARRSNSAPRPSRPAKRPAPTRRTRDRSTRPGPGRRPDRPR